MQKWLFLGFFIAFAIKAPLWPFHTWLPDAATASQPGTAVLLVGVMDKVGTFGMIRYCLQLFPAASRYFTPLILVLAVIGILYGAIVAIGQRDLKRLIAYTSISHFGFIVLGIFALTTQAQTGATLYMVNHAFATGALFLVAGFMIVRRRSQRIADYGGVYQVAPVMAGLFLVAGLAGLSLPGLSTFVSEFLVLIGTFSRYKVAASFATAGIILAAIYILWMYQRTMTGPVREEVADMPDLRPRELWAVGPLIALLIVFGVYPKPLLDVINPAVHDTLSQVHVTDPRPQHPDPAKLTDHGCYRGWRREDPPERHGRAASRREAPRDRVSRGGDDHPAAHRVRPALAAAAGLRPGRGRRPDRSLRAPRAAPPRPPDHHAGRPGRGLRAHDRGRRHLVAVRPRRARERPRRWVRSAWTARRSSSGARSWCSRSSACC